MHLLNRDTLADQRGVNSAMAPKLVTYR